MAENSIPNVRKYRSDTRSATKPDANIATPYVRRNAVSNVPRSADASGPSYQESGREIEKKIKLKNKDKFMTIIIINECEENLAIKIIY